MGERTAALPQWQTARSRRVVPSRVVAAGSALGCALALACAGPVQTTPPGSASSAVSPSPSSPPSAAPSATAAARPGLVTTRGGQSFVLRAESSPTAERQLPGTIFSPDGARVAYWTESGGSAQLHSAEIRGGDRLVAEFPAKRPGGIAWSVDGTGLLVSVADPDGQFLIPRTLIAVDTASGGKREVYQGTGPSGASVIPLVWRRDPEIFAAYETGPGGFHFGYTVIRPGAAPVRTDPDGRVVGMSASSDGAFVVGAWLDDETIKVWPVDDFSSKVELKVAPEKIVQPRWWPGRREIAFAIGRHDGSLFREPRIERWDPATGRRTTLKRLEDSGSLGGYYVRVDGTGLVTQTPGSGWEVTDLGSGSSSPVPLSQGEVILATALIR